MDILKGFKSITFNMICQYGEMEIISSANVLKGQGFKIIDVREADIIDKENKVIGKVCILKCKGQEIKYEKFKTKYKLTETMYEDLITLM